MINMCLTGKIDGYDRPIHPVLQILWGIIHRSNIDYAERIWEEFVQSIQTFLTDRKNLATAARGKKKTAHLLIPSVRFTKLIIHHLRTKHNIHPRTGSPLHYSHEFVLLVEVQGKGKEKVIDEQVAHDLLTLQTPTKMSPVDQFIFQRHPPTHTEPTGQAESPSLDVKLPLTDSETESDE
ncbi:hypothetical protein Tco_1225614, partial [Tanacetum coccineum]